MKRFFEELRNYGGFVVTALAAALVIFLFFSFVYTMKGARWLL